MGIQFGQIAGTSGKDFFGSVLFAAGINLPDFLNHLKKPWPSGNAKGFQGGGDSQTNGLFCTAGVSYHKVCGHGIQSAADTLH